MASCQILYSVLYNTSFYFQLKAIAPLHELHQYGLNFLNAFIWSIFILSSSNFFLNVAISIERKVKINK